MRLPSFKLHAFSADEEKCAEPEPLDFEPEPLDFGTIFESPTFLLCSGFLTSLWNAFGCSSDITLSLILACNKVLYECLQFANYSNKISKPTQFMKKILHDTNKVEKKFKANFDFEVSNSYQVPIVVSEVEI